MSENGDNRDYRGMSRVEYMDRRLNDEEEIARAPASNAPNLLHTDFSKRDLQAFGDSNARTCGECVHFKLGAAQQQMPKFLPWLIHDAGWKAHHLCADPSTMGVCGQHDNLLTGPNVKSCEYFRESRGNVIQLRGKR